jgi:hypothetical protein
MHNKDFNALKNSETSKIKGKNQILKGQENRASSGI